MIDDKVYTQTEILKLVSHIRKIKYIGDEKFKIENFMQINIHGIFIPYIISSYGRIFSINYAGKANNVKQLTTHVSNTGYERICISYKKMAINLSIHRVVASAFINNKDSLINFEVNHKDGNKLNNCVENLEWVTPKENVKHAFEFNLCKCGENHARSKYTNKQIIHVCELLTHNIKMKDIMEITNVSFVTIKDILYRKSWNHISCDYDFSEYNYGVTEKEFKEYIGRINTVCLMLEENFNFKSIRKKTNFTSNQISKILNKRTHKEISKYYDFSNYNYGKPTNYNDLIHQICKYGESGKYTMKEISDITGVSYKIVQRTLKGESHVDISYKYNLEKYRK